MNSSQLASIISIPVISGLIGWVTNYIAVKMIFRPQRPIRFLGLTLQGLVPRRQRELAQSIGEIVERELVSHEDIEAAIHTPDFQSELGALVENKIDDFLSKSLGSNPLIALFDQSDTIQQLKHSLRDQLQNSAPEIIESVLKGLEKHLDFQRVVQQKVEGFDLGKLEEIIQRIASRELKAIEYLGGVLGFIIGLGQLGLLAMMNP